MLSRLAHAPRRVVICFSFDAVDEAPLSRACVAETFLQVDVLRNCFNAFLHPFPLAGNWDSNSKAA